MKQLPFSKLHVHPQNVVHDPAARVAAVPGLPALGAGLTEAPVPARDVAVGPRAAAADRAGDPRTQAAVAAELRHARQDLLQSLLHLAVQLLQIPEVAVKFDTLLV